MGIEGHNFLSMPGSNRINSISPNRDWYQEGLNWGVQWLDDFDYWN